MQNKVFAKIIIWKLFAKVKFKVNLQIYIIVIHKFL